MWVQDTVSPHVNITAEIAKTEVDNFVRMCQVFSEYVPSFYEDSEFLENATSMENLSPLDTVQDANLLRLIEEGISNSQSPEVLRARQRDEHEILSILKTFIQSFDPSLELHPFGSVMYGIRRGDANFNLLVITST